MKESGGSARTRILCDILPRTVTTAAPGVAVVRSATLATIKGETNAIKSLAAGLALHGPEGLAIAHELVVAGTILDGLRRRPLRPNMRRGLPGQCNFFVDIAAAALHHAFMTSQELKRWLTKQGCAFGSQTGSHLKVFLGDKRTVLPMHGQKKDLREGLINSIKKDLGLK